MRIAVILIDAYTAPPGVAAERKDPRWPWGYAVDTNFMDTFDALLTANRKNMLAWFVYSELSKLSATEPRFCHFTWEPGDSPAPPQSNEFELTLLRPWLSKIPTDFRLSEQSASLLDRAAELLVSEDNPCLADIARMVLPAGDEPAP